ncbi:MAG: leucine--tRNA ligase [Defluviitaleaceae bacterium]|nr:leucine--tRNA ligase [Defluviitaleaceae bacterium]
MSRYDFSSIEKKWRDHWQANPIQDENSDKPTHYCLDMFPYPSGEGLHVGHWRGYVLSDVLSRYKILQGYHVLHPMGWDAFGLPAENHAIEHGIHPAVNTAENIRTIKRQLKEIGAVYDWDREINTTDPAYYKWTQWIFVQMFKKGLAYEKDMPLNWCPKCKTVLANEEALGGECERCKSGVTKKMLRQWMLKITAYADRLLADLENLDWPEKVKKMQADWIGKSYGAELDFEVENSDQKIRVFTTRPDTLYGATFMVMAPEHPLVARLVSAEQAEAVKDYVQRAASRSSVDRMSDKEKTGVFLGCYAINPLDRDMKMPIWISDYVLADYGTGAIMCVPAHDERDFEFAKKFDLYIRQVIIAEGEDANKPLEEVYTNDGLMINSGRFNGMNNRQALEEISQEAEKMGIGKQTTNFKLRDWVFSRQRYWGEPIPIIHCPTCGIVPVPEDQLPVLLPDVESYLPTDTGESPLAAVTEWVNTTCPTCGIAAKRETNTMPTWAGSSWYFLRYADPHNDEQLAGSEALKKWLPVDYYVGGVEHAVLHLLYARFYTKFLYDIGAVEFEEPFVKLFNQGMITRHGRKMSKSIGNGISPDDIISQYGCDALRLYELFVGPPAMDSDWDDSGIEGVFRYLTRTRKLFNQYKDNTIEATPEMTRLRHLFIKDISQRLDNLTMNTVVSGFMEHTSTLTDLAKKAGGIDAETMDALTIMLAPFAPHLAEELWQMRGNKDTVFANEWPKYDESQIKSDTLNLAIQVNGRLRGQLTVDANASKEDVLSQAKTELAKWLDGMQIVKEIYVPGKIVNIVVKQ